MKGGLLATYWRYTGTASQISCSTQWTAYLTDNTQVTTIKIDSSINHPNSSREWDGINNNYLNKNFGVTWSGYLNLDSTASYSFKTNTIGGSILEIDDVVVINAVTQACVNFNNKYESESKRYEKGYHKIVIRYFHRIEAEKGFQILYRTGTDEFKVIPSDKFYYAPPSKLFYSYIEEVYTSTATIQVSNRNTPILYTGTGTCTNYAISPSITDTGLSFATTTVGQTVAGSITGLPTGDRERKEYTVTCTYNGEVLSTKIYVSVQNFNVPKGIKMQTGASQSDIASLIYGDKLNITMISEGNSAKYFSVANLPSNYQYDSVSGIITGTCLKAAITT